MAEPITGKLHGLSAKDRADVIEAAMDHKYWSELAQQTAHAGYTLTPEQVFFALLGDGLEQPGLRVGQQKALMAFVKGRKDRVYGVPQATGGHRPKKVVPMRAPAPPSVWYTTEVMVRHTGAKPGWIYQQGRKPGTEGTLWRWKTDAPKPVKEFELNALQKLILSERYKTHDHLLEYRPWPAELPPVVKDQA